VTLTLTVALSNATGCSYQWARDGAAVGTNSNTYSAVIDTGGTYTVKVTNSNGCTVTSAQAIVKVMGDETGEIATTLPDGTPAACTSGVPGELALTITGCA
jgi:hypothetical protein